MTGEAIRKKAFLNWRLRLQTSGIYRDPAIPGCQNKFKTSGTAANAAAFSCKATRATTAQF
jgi:hypothetical protein